MEQRVCGENQIHPNVPVVLWVAKQGYIYIFKKGLKKKEWLLAKQHK